jgi:2-C-methyl-D-erythritol 4-phosphate cytidylyltransferase/2-C-methyl-D-erythritol 2,4-cyclodiphosphate synthase
LYNVFMSCWGLIVAAGAGRRIGGAVPKQYRELAGRPLLAWTLGAFERAAAIDAVVLTVAADQLERARAVVEEHELTKVLKIVAGGAERSESVCRGLDALEGRDDDLVAIHDGARPLVAPALIERVVAAAARDGAAIPAVPIPDTVKRAEGRTVRATVDRSQLYLAQTPQVFRLELIRRAYASTGPGAPTDDAQVVEELGEPVRLVEGDPENLKVTVAEDLERAATLLGGRVPAPRVAVGTGLDVHRLVPGRPLILGGVTVPFPLGLQGHSDADVLAHAVGDALLGAAALGDLGRHFPPGDPDLRGISSMILLERIGEMVREAGLTVGNVDATVVCQAPRLAPHIDAMVANMAAALHVPRGRVSVKATTTEGLGFTGEGDGIAAQAVVLLQGA